MRLLQLILLFAALLSLCLSNAQIEKNEFDATAVDSTDLHLHYGASPQTEYDYHHDYHKKQSTEQQQTLTLPPVSPPTLIEQILVQFKVWQFQLQQYLEQRFPHYFGLLKHIHKLTKQAEQEQKVAGRRYILLTWNDIYFDLRRLVPWSVWPMDERQIVTTDSTTRRRAIAETTKKLYPRSLQHDAIAMQIRLLHWATDASERCTAITQHLTTFYDDVLNQALELTHGFIKEDNETISPMTMTYEINQLLLRTKIQGLALTRELSRFIDSEFAKIVWLSGPLRPWFEELNAVSISEMMNIYKNAMDTSVSRIRTTIHNSNQISTNYNNDDNVILQEQQKDLASAIQAAVNESKQQSEQVFVQVEKQLHAIWENAASEIRASPWTTPYWEDTLKNTVVATKSHVLSIKSMIQSIFARLAGCQCGTAMD
ncbi:hypothetical protein BDC45DRAFT_517088 [Circinella umbellata]|nr:hypothetical protein BDC45DRAFT_517088 [Circinella umbellata]